MKWTIEVEGGPAFPVNAYLALHHAAESRPEGPMRDVFTRLADAFRELDGDDRELDPIDY